MRIVLINYDNKGNIIFDGSYPLAEVELMTANSRREGSGYNLGRSFGSCYLGSQNWLAVSNWTSSQVSDLIFLQGLHVVMIFHDVKDLNSIVHLSSEMGWI